jgi:hypothetical protein
MLAHAHTHTHTHKHTKSRHKGYHHFITRGLSSDGLVGIATKPKTIHGHHANVIQFYWILHKKPSQQLKLMQCARSTTLVIFLNNRGFKDHHQDMIMQWTQVWRRIAADPSEDQCCIGIRSWLGFCRGYEAAVDPPHRKEHRSGESVGATCVEHV